ncbi:hypothetical protein BJX66DRAFT_151435 [Aspergillus keveii]|uniref:Secreted protein n=1 Tax=Aspergillus keveii TaxID=714993 RepID=A0ABR4GNS4_9EURO
MAVLLSCCLYYTSTGAVTWSGLSARHLPDFDVCDYIVSYHFVTWGKLLLRSDSLLYRDDRGYASIQPRSKENMPARLEPHTGSRTL